ncbi:MAG: phosphonatase-like hydrolase [Myxococcales bacterium]|nr:phosphonatase-like hydrolase [Myxococcales bacterium]
MSIGLVVFDMAGTTVFDDGHVNRAFRDAAEEFALAVSKEAVDALMGFSKREAITEIVAANTGRRDDSSLIDSIYERFVDLMVEHYMSNPEVREIPGASGVFRTLRSMGIRVGLDTGFPRRIAEALVNRLGWQVGRDIDALVAGDDLAKGRPAPLMIQKIMSDLGVASSSAVAKVGDTLVDVLEGRNAGCGLVVGVTSGSCDRAQLEEAGPDHILESVADLPALLRTMGAVYHIQA